MDASGTPRQADLDRLVEFIVEHVHPLRIVLFGSAARGTMHANSDLDVLVVMPDGTTRRPVTQELYVALGKHELGLLPVEIHVTTPSLVSRYRDNAGTLYYDAMREGRELYVAA